MKRIGATRTRAFHMPHQKFGALPVSRRDFADRTGEKMRKAVADWTWLHTQPSRFRLWCYQAQGRPRLP